MNVHPHLNLTWGTDDAPQAHYSVGDDETKTNAFSKLFQVLSLSGPFTEHQSTAKGH